MTHEIKIEHELTEKEAAAMLGITAQALAVQRYRKSPTAIPYIKRGVRVLYRMRDIEERLRGKLIRPE